MSSNHQSSGYVYAMSSGIFACGASFCGKLLGFVEHGDFAMRAILYGILVGIMILLNTMVWSFYIKALHSKSGTLNVTVVSSASNFIISDFLGRIVFGEQISVTSIVGTIFTILGVFVLTKGSKDKKEE